VSSSDAGTTKAKADAAWSELAKELGRRTPRRLTNALRERRRLNLLTRRL